MSDRDRIVSYLQGQAAKLTVPELVDKVRNDAVQMREAMLAVPRQHFGQLRDDGEWCGNQIAAHIVTTGDDFARAIEAIVAGRAPDATPIDALGDDIEDLPASEWWIRHTANRERLFAAVLAADPDAHLEPIIHHPIFGNLNWREALLFLRVHDLDHARQFASLR